MAVRSKAPGRKFTVNKSIHLTKRVLGSAKHLKLTKKRVSELKIKLKALLKEKKEFNY